ncbi:MAG: hypothetical protein IT385_31105 [Deltaproteobacteria bacterium]|nr:hypothetical protein [Deltaproteobacteria bacterium]
MRAALLVTMVLGTLLAPAARAADLCAEARGQPTADPEHPLAQTAFGVWERVYGAFNALTGRRTDIVVLGKEARLKDGQPFPPNAFICPVDAGRTTPTMTVTWPMLELVQSRKLYDVDFLALVLGHELGHRANDFDWVGKITTRPGATKVEDKADIRGAFFAAAAGYSTRRLACDDALDLFLNIEANVPEATRKGRKAALMDVLRTFDVYESLYDAAAALVFWDAAKGRHLLRWVDEHMALKMEPVPEFKVLAALGILMDAADKSCWTIKTRLPDMLEASPTHLRCAAVYPTHTAFWDDVPGGGADDTRMCGTGIDLDVEGGPDRARTAVGLLEDALALGADELVVRSGLACAYAYRAKPKEAQRELGKALALVGPHTPANVKAALESNRAFIGWLGWMIDNPPPSAADARPAWGKKLQTAAPGFAAHRELSAWIARLKGFPAVLPAARPAAIQCAREPAKADPSSGMTMLPAFPRDARSGGCPCGWSELHYLDNELGTSADDGVRTCVPAGWGVGQRWIDIDLPREQVPSTKLVVHDALDGPIASLRTWEKRCQVLEGRGVGHDGSRVFAGLCPDLGAGEVVIVADDCRITRAVVMKGP